MIKAQKHGVITIYETPKLFKTVLDYTFARLYLNCEVVVVLSIEETVATLGEVRAESHPCIRRRCLGVAMEIFTS